jgi:hypothetical protein
MAVLSETGLWEAGVYQLEVEDGPAGGAEGIDNVPLRHLADRTRFLNEARVLGYIAGQGRSLLTVLGVSNIAQAMAALRVLCNGTGTPDFSKLQIGGYLDDVIAVVPNDNRAFPERRFISVERDSESGSPEGVVQGPQGRSITSKDIRTERRNGHAVPPASFRRQAVRHSL